MEKRPKPREMPGNMTPRQRRENWWHYHWLYVLAARPYIPSYDGPQRTEYEAGGSGDPAFASHKHNLIIKPWMPKVGEQVLCLYEPIRDGRGFVLGGIQAWQ